MKRIEVLKKRIFILKVEAEDARKRYEVAGYTNRHAELAEMPLAVEEAISSENWKVAASCLKKQECRLGFLFEELATIEHLQKFFSQNRG